MNQHIQTILETIARQHGVPVREVCDEIQSALDEAYANPATRAAWLRYGFDHRPSVEEFLLILSVQVQEKRTPGTKPGAPKSEISG